MKKKYTINDIALMSGVAKSTVSRYLNGGNVKAETRDKIQKVIEESNYEANVFARLSAKNSYIMGIIVPGIDSTVTPKILTVMDEYLKEEKYMPLLINTGGDLDLEIKSIDRLASLNVDGIIIIATKITKKHQQIIDRINIPVVFLGQEYENGISIVDDDYRAGKEMGNYIARCNLKKVACIWVKDDDIAVGIKRKNGVIDGLHENHINDIDFYISDFSYEKSIEIANKILTSNNVPDIIVCATDRIAFGVYKVAQQLKLKIPEDISITGFGGYETSEILTPPLTTIRFDLRAVACVGVETILKMINEKPVSKMQIISYKFIEGGSVKVIK